MNKLKYLKLLLVLLFILTASACATTESVSEDENATGDNFNVKFNVLSQGAFSNISLPNQLVINNKKDWLRLTKIHGSTDDYKKIDFDEKIVIAIFAGQQSSGGYTVGVSNIKRVDSNLYVTVTFTEPKKNQSFSLALSQPYIILATDKVDGKIIFLAPQSKKIQN